MRALGYGGAGLLMTIWLGAAPTAEWIGPSAHGDTLAPRDLERLLAENPLGANDNIRALPLSRNDRSANLLVQIRDREPLHHHADSDITVFLLRGHGRIQLGERVHAVKAGDVMHIPRGAVHAYINEGAVPGVALVVYSPAPGPDDRVLVESK